MAKPHLPTPDQYLQSLTPDLPPQPKSRRRRIRRILLWLGVAILAVVAAVLIFIAVNLAKLSVNPFGFGPLAATDGRTNILVLGIGDPGHAGEKLSDTIMVISLNHPTHQVAMISVPRDLRVNIPGYGYNKINAANSLGGSQLAEQVVSATLGIPIHYVITTDFTGLKQAIDAVGGLDVTVTQRLYDPEYPCANDETKACGIDIQPGQYHMDGALALEYARCRKGTCGNDFGRAARQQEIMSKLKDKVTQPSTYLNVATDAALISAISNNAKTDMSINKLIEAGWDMKGAKQTINFVFSTAPGGLLANAADGSSDLVPVSGDFSQMEDLVQNIFTNPPSQETQ